MNYTKEKTNTNYIDITKGCLKKANPNSHKVRDLHYYKYKGKKYYVDGKNVVLDYSEKEKEIANWLKGTFGGPIYMCPRVNNPEGISTPDYLWNNEKWDLKELHGNSKRVVDNALKKKKAQANNFILDISDKTTNNIDAINQIKHIFNTNGRKWIKTIIVKDENNLVVIYKKRD